MKVIGIDKQFTTSEEVEADINQGNFSNMMESAKCYIFSQTKNQIVQE